MSRPPPELGRRQVSLPALVAAVGLLALAFAVAVAAVATDVARHDATAARDVERVRLALLRAHLALEEGLAGDRDAVAGEEQARRELGSRLQRLAGEEELAAAIDDLVASVAAVERAARVRRQLSGPAAAPGADAERAYDRAQASAEQRVAALEAALAAHSARHWRSARSLLVAAGLAWCLAVAVAAALLGVHQRSRARAEEALRERDRTLAAAQRMEAVGRLAGGLAHDLNNALAAVRAHCELARDKAGELTPERLRGKMELVLASVLRASSLLERLLAFARPQPVRTEPLRLDEVVGELVRVLGSTLPPGVRLEVASSPGLWAVDADVARLEQVITNLFVNAADALGGQGTLRLATANVGGPRGDEVCLEVADDGPGIPSELRERIFEPFFTTKEGVGRSGLGLAVVHGLVEQLGGRVEVAGEPGRGATFRVLLPRSRGGARATGGERAERGHGERLLLVDDDAAAREAVAALLESLGYRVTPAAGREQALAVATAEAPFDAVVTDVRLADGNGPELVAELRRHAPLRALYMSGYTDRIALRHGPRPGEAYFLKKPFSGEGLARMLRELLAGPPAADEAALRAGAVR